MCVVFVALIVNSCATKCPQSVVEPQTIGFKFIITDENGNNLFFGTDSIYNPNDVKFAVGQNPDDVPQEWFQVLNQLQCFELSDFIPKTEPYVFYFKFIPNNTDTVTIKSIFSDVVNECSGFPAFYINVSFNDLLVCADCSNNIHKIVLQ
jgi:hypothetical protein